MPPTRETYNILQHGHGPELVFAVQPAKEHRFRYKSEFKKGSHGHLKGRTPAASGPKGKKNKDKVPVVHLLNYVGSEPVTLRITLHTPDGHCVHAHKLVEGSSNLERQPDCVERPSDRLNATALEWRITNVSILYKGKLEDSFFDSQYHDAWSSLTETMKKQKRSEIENAVLLRVEALRSDGTVVCPPIFSERILNTKSKNSGNLNIEHIDKVSGYVSGGEQVFILCNKIPSSLTNASNPNASKVYVEFFENDGELKKVWHQKADLQVIHHQAAIIFKTPPYRWQNTDTDVEVFMQLKCTDNDVEDSEARHFTYRPREDGQLARKRKKVDEIDASQSGMLSGMSTGQTLSLVSPFGQSMQSSFAETGGQHMPMAPQASFGYLGNLPPSGQEPMAPQASFGYLGNLPPSGQELMAQQASVGYPGNLPLSDQELMEQPDAFGRNLNIDYDRVMIDIENRDPFLSAGYETDTIDEETLRQLGQAGKPTPDSDAKESPAAPQSNGVPAPVHPDKFLAYKLALHTAQCLHNFAKTGDVRILLMSMRHLVALQDEQGDNAIHAAVIHSQSEAMKNLVEVARTVANYDILNMCNELKESPLHIAIQTSQVNAIRLLLYHGANPNVKDKKGNTPIHLAAQFKNAESLSALLDTNAYVNKYKNHGPNLNALNFSGFSALHLAVQSDSLSAVERLCYAGCDVDVRDRTSGRTALHFAVERHSLEIVGFLLHQASAETDIHMFNGNTPLHLACSQNHSDTVSLLMQAKADPYLENYEKAENNEDDNDSLGSASLDDDEDVRGLTSMDLASSEEIRSLLRGEAPLSSASAGKPLYEYEEATAAPIEVVHAKGDPEKSGKKNNILDSGIGLSGMGLSGVSLHDSSISIDSSNVQQKLTLSDILDSATKDRLAKILDAPPDHNWKRVLDLLNMDALEKSLANHKSPTQGMLHYIEEIEVLENVLEALVLNDAVRVLHDAKIRRGAEEWHLDSQMRKMKL